MLNRHYFCTTTHGLVIAPAHDRLPQKVDDRYAASQQSDIGENATELAWLNYFMHNTPNGSLYFDNDTRLLVNSGRSIVLVHATLSLDAIRRSGIFYPSVGCLGATIFTVPLTSDQRLHNFTQYILDHEIPMIQHAKPADERLPALLGIKIKGHIQQNANQHSYGFHYLHIGPLQYKVYRDMAERFRSAEDQRRFKQFERAVTRQIREARNFLNLCSEYNVDNVRTDAFFDQFHAALQALPFLGYIYFETLSEYVQLHQVDAESERLKQRGELNIRHFKDLIYALAPGLAAGFDLEKMRPTIAEVIAGIKTMNRDRKLFKDFDTAEFLHFMKWRLAQSIRLKALGGKPLPKIVNFNSNIALSGHIVHRLIGETSYMNPYLWEYDTLRAQRIWEDWQTNDITFVENAVMPRGEVGINPLPSPDDYEIHLLNVDPSTGIVTFKERLNVTIAQTIAGNSLMGSSNNPKGTHV